MRWVCGLTDRGPFAPIFRTVTDPNQPANWLGNTIDGGDDD